MASISFGKWIVLCQQYFGPVTETKSAYIVDSRFHSAFDTIINPVLKRLLMDGRPRHNS